MSKSEKAVAAPASARRRSVLRQLRTALIGTDPEGAITSWNRGAAALLGYSAKEARGRHISFIYIPSPETDSLRSFWNVSAISRGARDFDLPVRTKAGDERVLRLSLSLITDDSGHPHRILAVALDTTPLNTRFAQAEALREKEAIFRGIFESSPDCLKILDADGRLLEMNGPGLRLLGIDSFDSIRGKIWADLWGEGSAQAARALEQAKTCGTGHFQASFGAKTGVIRHWDVKVTAIPDTAATARRFIATSRDITGERNKELALQAGERQLQQRATELTRANEDLLHFAYAVSHDLQSPLRTVHTFAQLLDRKFRPALEDEGGKLIAGIVSASSRMGTLIQDLLRFAKVAGTVDAEGTEDAAGSAEAAHAATPLGKALESALQSCAGSIAESGAKITCDPLPVLRGDAGQFAQLFQNLIGNAIKYRKPGTPPVIHISSARNGAEWVIAIQDNGIGFEPQHAERIFGVFQRLHGSEYAGTGIGLTICKRIVERHGGRIRAESTGGEGARFSFSLPAEGHPVAALIPETGKHPVPPEPAETAILGELFHTLDLAQALVRNLEGKIVVWTRGAERLFGFSQTEALGQNAGDLLHKQFASSRQEIEAELLRAGEWTGELQARKKDGSTIWLASHLSLHRDGSGRPQSVVEVHNGINEFKEAQAALRRSLEQRDLALRAGGMSIGHVDLVNELVAWDETLGRIIDGEPKAFSGPASEFVARMHPDDLVAVRAEVGEALARTREYRIDYRFRRTDGSWCWLRSRGQGRFDETGRPIGLMGVTWDNNTQKHAELELRESEARFRALFCDSPTPMSVTLPDGRYLQVNRACCEMLGYTEAELLQEDDVNVTHPDDRAAAQEGSRRMLAGEIPLYRAVKRYLRKDGRVGWCDTSVAVVRNSDGSVAGFATQARDITEQRNAEEALRASEARLKTIFEHSPMGIAFCDLTGGLSGVNAAFVKMLGYEEAELLGRKFPEFTVQEDLPAEQQYIQEMFERKRDSYTLEKRYIRKNGEVIWVDLCSTLFRDDKGNPTFGVAMVQEIGARKQAERDQRFLLDLSAKLTQARLPDEMSAMAVAEIAGFLGVSRCSFIAIDVDADIADVLADVNTHGPAAPGKYALHDFGKAMEYLRANQVIAIGDTRTDPRTRDAFDATYAPLGLRSTLGVPLHRDSVWRATISASHHQPRDWQEREIALLRGVAERLWPAQENARLFEEARARKAESDAQGALALARLAEIEALYANAPVGLLYLDRDLRFVRINEHLARINGIPVADHIGRTLAEVLPELAPTLEPQLRRVMETGQPIVESELRGATPGSPESGSVWLVSYFPLLAADGSVVGLNGVVQDITARKQAEEAWLESAERLQIATVAAGLGVLSWDGRNNKMIWENQLAYEIFGRTRSQGPFGREEFLETVLHPDDLESVTRFNREATSGKRAKSDPCRIRRPDGALRWIQFHASAEFAPDGSPQSMIGVVADVTDQMEARNALLEERRHLRESEERSRLMLDSIDQLAWTARADGSIYWYNRRWYEYTGTTAEQMEGGGWQSVHHPARLPEVLERWTAALQTGEPFEMEFPLRGADGIFRSFLTRVQPLRDSIGQVVQWFGTNTNIEAIRQARDVLEESERRFRELAESLPDFVWAADPQGQITYSNPQFYTYTGAADGQALREKWLACVHPEDVAALASNWRRAVAEGVSYKSEARYRRHDGIYRWFLNRAEPLRDERGQIAKWLGTSTDIHEQKLTEQELRRLNADLEQFAYAANHDLQEPLRAITTYSQLLEQAYSDKGAQAALFTKFIVSGTKRMDRLLKGVLEYSGAGDSAESIAVVDSKAVVEKILRRLEPEIAESGATLIVGALPEVRFHERQFSQLLEKLLGNALRYRANRPLRIEISATREGEWQKFSVADNGIGIREEYLEQIFGVFKRLHRDEYLAGVGLAVCKKIVERQGGRIWAESAFGRGSTFFFTIPASPPDWRVQAPGLEVR